MLELGCDSVCLVPVFHQQALFDELSQATRGGTLVWEVLGVDAMQVA